MVGRIFPNSMLFRSHSHVAWVSTKSKAMRGAAQHPPPRGSGWEEDGQAQLQHGMAWAGGGGGRWLQNRMMVEL